MESSTTDSRNTLMRSGLAELETSTRTAIPICELVLPTLILPSSHLGKRMLFSVSRPDLVFE